MAAAANVMLASPSWAPQHQQQQHHQPVQERLVTWKELRRAYDFADNVTAQGGYGSIFVGTKVATGEEVVLKVVNVHSCAYRRFRYLTQETVEELRRYIVREWTFLATLSHPGIVSAKDDYIFRIRNPCRCGGDHAALPDKEHDDVYVIVMERMDLDLYDKMHYFKAYRQSPSRLKLTSFNQLIYSRLPPRMARSLFYQVCKALDYLHERPILHRDLSWGNIMFRRDAQGRLQAKIVDLGLSRDLPKTPSGLSVENIGTLAFCAPELHYSELKTCGYGSRIDVWSLGIILYLMLTGNADPNERSLRFRNTIDAIENDHDFCIDARQRAGGAAGGNNGKKGGGGGVVRTCTFCEEVVNDRFQEAISPEEMRVKHEALSLLEGMLTVTPDERLSIKQVLGHPWLAEERAQDPHPVDTQEAAPLFAIPRGSSQGNNNQMDVGFAGGVASSPPPSLQLQVSVRIMEFPYLRDPACTIVASSYRQGTADVRLGDVTTFGGILSRVGVQTGDRMLAALGQPFGPHDYLVPLDACIPRKARGKYFHQAYLCLLDHPNDRRSIYGCYRALRRGLHLAPASRAVILPLIGFDFKFAEGSVYGQGGALGDAARKQFVLQQWLSFAYHVARAHPHVESLALSSWKRSTFTLVKELCGSGSGSGSTDAASATINPPPTTAGAAATTPVLPLSDGALFDDQLFCERLRAKAAVLHALFLESGPWAALEPLAPGLRDAWEAGVLPLLQQWAPGDYPEQEAALCRAVGTLARLLLPLVIEGAVAPAGGAPGHEREAREAVFLALLTMESNLEKLELFPADADDGGDGDTGDSGGIPLVNRVDASLSVDALELVLGRCVAGPTAARLLRGGR